MKIKLVSLLSTILLSLFFFSTLGCAGVRVASGPSETYVPSPVETAAKTGGSVRIEIGEFSWGEEGIRIEILATNDGDKVLEYGVDSYEDEPKMGYPRFKKDGVEEVLGYCATGREVRLLRPGETAHFRIPSYKSSSLWVQDGDRRVGYDFMTPDQKRLAFWSEPRKLTADELALIRKAEENVK